MKKNLLILTTLAAALASCSGEDALVDDQSQSANGTAIAFQTYTNKATRATAENSTETAQLGLEDHHSTFSVWGYKDVQTDFVFGTAYASGATTSTAGQKVEYKEWVSGTNSWNYEPMRFWDKNSNSYEFYAAAPETTTGPLWTLNKNTADSQSDDYFTLSNVTLKNASLTSTSYVESMKEDKNVITSGATHSETGNIDYMIASPKNVAYSAYNTAVELDFNHILSRLNVTVKKGTTLAGAGDAGKLAITSLEVCNMANVGSFDEHLASGTTLSNGTVTRWGTPTGTLTYQGNSLDDVTTTASYILQSLVMPQTVAYEIVTRDGKYGASNTAMNTSAKPYIKIVYTIGTTNPETYTAYYNLSNIFGGSYKEKAVTEGTTVAGLYKRTGDSRDTYAYVACDATETAVSGTTYYEFAGTNVDFNEGWQNTLNITIDADAIKFNPQVFKWEDNLANTNSYTIK